jgi:hypothetical protein
LRRQERTRANISFQTSVDGASWFDLFNGEEVVKLFAADRAVLIDPPIAIAMPFLRIRSGSRQSPVAQQDDRVITVVWSKE